MRFAAAKTARDAVAPTNLKRPNRGAFVIELARSSRLESGDLHGRIEHVASGHAETFRSIDEMLAIVIDTLRRTPEFVATRENERSDVCEPSRARARARASEDYGALGLS